MPQLLLHTSRAFILAFLAFFSLTLSFPSCTFAKGFEVWLVDQSNSFDKTYGGAIYIYEGSDLSGKVASSAPPAKVDLGNDAAGGVAHLCLSQTGAHPVRPHMLLFNSSHSHAILSFVTSGHVVIVEAASRTPVACLHTSVGTTGARQAHAAFPAPDDSYILVANQNGKLLERIDVNYETNAFVLNPAATINLATCTTPNGLPCELAEVRPNNAPICPIIDSSSHLGFVTLAGGGLFVVDPTTTPMQILAEYTQTVIHGNGCGGIEAKGSMYINSGAGTETGNPSEFDVYRFPLAGYSASNWPNTPAPVVVFSDDTQPPAPERDSHGSVVTKQERYLWVMDRGLNVAEVFDTSSDAHINTIDLNGQQSGLAPDLADISPSGHRIFVSLRGPNPLSGSPHVASGSIPGLGVIEVKAGGKNGVLRSIFPISNMDAGGIERGDAHGIRVRVK
jgi:hypothetical protein